MDVTNVNAERAIAAAETLHSCLEASLWAFIAAALAEGWTEDEIDAQLERFGFCLAPAECYH